MVGSKTSNTSFFMVETKTSYNILLARDWIHANMCVQLSLHQTLMFGYYITWSIEKVKAYDKSFVINSRMVDAWLYSNDVGLVQFMSINNMGCLINFLVNKKLV